MATLPVESCSSLPSSSTAPTGEASAADVGRDYTCSAEEVADAKLTTRRETLIIIESLTQDFLRAIANGDDPELHLVNINMFMYNNNICTVMVSVSLLPLSFHVPQHTHTHTHTHTHRPLVQKRMCFVIPKDACIWARQNLLRGFLQRMALEQRDMPRVSSVAELAMLANSPTSSIAMWSNIVYNLWGSMNFVVCSTSSLTLIVHPSA